MRVYELRPIHSSSKTFGGKAQIISNGDTHRLQSYDTHVATVTINLHGPNELVVILSDGDDPLWSATTVRHIREFMEQNGFGNLSKARIIKQYGVSA